MSLCQQIKLQTTWLHYTDTLKQELSGTKAYEHTSVKEKPITTFFIMPPGLL